MRSVLRKYDLTWDEKDVVNNPEHRAEMVERSGQMLQPCVEINGNMLADGDTVTVIKDLKVKGSSSVVKVGTKVKNIRLVEGDHDIDCKVDGIGPMKLKSIFVKKA